MFCLSSRIQIKNGIHNFTLNLLYAQIIFFLVFVFITKPYFAVRILLINSNGFLNILTYIDSSNKNYEMSTECFLHRPKKKKSKSMVVDLVSLSCVE